MNELENSLPANTQIIDNDGNVNTSQLQSQDITKYNEMNKTLTLEDPNAILNYGVDIQNAMEKYSNEFLTSVRAFNSGDVGLLINDLLTEINYIDVDELDQSSFKKFLKGIPFLNKLVFDAQKLFSKYDTISGNIDKITTKIKAGRINSIKDNASLQTMFDQNVNYIKQLEDLVIAGNLKKEEFQQKLAEMEGNPTAYKDYEIADCREFVNRLDKKLADLKIVRYVMMQSLAQIRLVQNNNNAIAEKAQSIVTTTLPVWKNQLTLAIALQRQKANVDIQRKVSETTNTILEKNAELLKQNSIEVARENENTIVSIETLKKTTTSLISTLNDVKQIHEKGAESRKQLDTDLKSLEQELRKNVTQTR